MGRIGVYFEAAAVIISLTLLGQILELKARSRTSAAIKSLLGLSPKPARRIGARCGGRYTDHTCISAIFCGSGPAKRCPLDGVVTEGSSAVDESDADRRSSPRDQAQRRQVDRRHDDTSGA